MKSKNYYGTINIKHLHRVGNLRGCDPSKLFSNQVKQEIMTEKYIIQPSGDQILMVEKETNTALYAKEVVKKLNEHAEMVEALKVIRDSFWTEPSESKKHIELQDIAKSILKEMKP